MSFTYHQAALNRRDFLRICATASAMMGLPDAGSAQVVQAAQAPLKLPVIWLHFQECTGCSESLLRSSHPSVSSFLLDLISLDYHETLMAAAGIQAEECLHRAARQASGAYLLVAEGAIPTAAGGVFCKVGGKTAVARLREVADGARAIISLGTCASFGGIQAASPNPTGAVGIGELIKAKPLINIPGCPPNVYNFLSTVLYFLTFQRWPDLDALRRPKFAYSRRLHEHCERRPHFDSGRFAQRYGDEGHRAGYCLYKLGCKGPATYGNCSVQHFNDAGVWPVSIGHPCAGCTERDVAFNLALAEKVPLKEPTPFEGFASVEASHKGKGPDALTTGLLGVAAGMAVTAGAMFAKRLPGSVPPGAQDANDSHV
ncbi:MAG: hydrogenase small subunit [Verrucomicrobiota bacterium]